MHSVQKSIDNLFKKDEKFTERYNEIKNSILSNEKIIFFLKEHENELTPDMIERGLVKLHEYSEQVTNCDNCTSLETCQNYLKGYYPQLVIKNNTIDIQYAVCAKKEMHDSHKKLQSLIQSVYIPKDILHAKLSDFTVDDGRIDAITEAKNFFSTYEKGKFQKGLYFYGSFGVGKTYFLGALANEFANRKIPSMIVYVPEFLRELKGSIQSNTVDEKVEAIKHIEVLMLDDIGAESMSSWVRDDILGPLLQFRMQEQLPTFFTSNFDFKQLKHHFTYTQRGESEEMKALRIMERIEYLTKPIEIKGTNRRK